MNSRQCHLVGVAGVGMNPLAQALVANGWEVTGSDRYYDTGRELDVLPKLRRAGVRLVPQDGSGIGPTTEAVVVSTAIEDDNADLAAARRCGVPVVHRSEMLARLAEGSECIAITGTCGKTTVTGMVGYLLEQLGDDPTVVNGGALVNWEDDETVGNFRRGRSARWVIEADESDRSCLRYNPAWAVITNTSPDHFAPDATDALFAAFAERVPEGHLIGPAGGSPAWDGFEPELGASGARFVHGGQTFTLPLLGHHNASNALHAVLLCELLGHPLDRIADALATFRGIRRRLDVAGSARGVTVIDDYAHNPAKIEAAWQAVAPHCDRVLAIWRPHGFGPLAKLYEPMKALFRRMGESGARLYILPVYYVGGTTSPTHTSEMLVADLEADGVPIELVADYGAVVAGVRATARPGDVVLTLGARDPDLPALARSLVVMFARGWASASG